MGLFRRKNRNELGGPQQTPTPPPTTIEVPGPKDSAGEPAPVGYLDLGALYVPSIPGMQLTAQLGPDKVTTTRVLLVVGSSGIQISVVAAPRSGGAGPEMLQQISDSITNGGGQVQAIQGRYGAELDAKVAVTLPNGTQGFTPHRIYGIEGPRWLIRIDVHGAAAAGDAKQLEECHKIIDRLIVNRGEEARIRFELLPLRFPKGAVAEDGVV